MCSILLSRWVGAPGCASPEIVHIPPSPAGRMWIPILTAYDYMSVYCGYSIVCEMGLTVAFIYILLMTTNWVFLYIFAVFHPHGHPGSVAVAVITHLDAGKNMGLS